MQQYRDRTWYILLFFSPALSCQAWWTKLVTNMDGGAIFSYSKKLPPISNVSSIIYYMERDKEGKKSKHVVIVPCAT